MSLEYHVVDVFTDRAFAGNPLAVVLDGSSLSTAQMQAIAREFNLSETTFVLPATTSDATYRLRIFTPLAELPFAGHPSVGTAWLLRSLGVVDDGTVVQECKAGLMPLAIDGRQVELTGGTPTLSDVEDADCALAAVGLSAADAVGTPVRRAGCGLEWTYLHLDDEAVTRAAVDIRALRGIDSAGVCAFSFADGRAHSRCFAGDLGVPEDPATGSAALGLGVFLVASGLLPGDGESKYVVSQGAEMGRPSTLHVTVSAENGAAQQVRVEGTAVLVASGRINPPSE